MPWTLGTTHPSHLAVAYVKFDRASSAAAAQEHLHETVLSDGRTKLKVMLAEAPNSRWELPGIARESPAPHLQLTTSAIRPSTKKGKCNMRGWSQAWWSWASVEWRPGGGHRPRQRPAAVTPVHRRPEER